MGTALPFYTLQFPKSLVRPEKGREVPQKPRRVGDFRLYQGTYLLLPEQARFPGNRLRSPRDPADEAA